MRPGDRLGTGMWIRRSCRCRRRCARMVAGLQERPSSAFSSRTARSPSGRLGPRPQRAGVGSGDIRVGALAAIPQSSSSSTPRRSAWRASRLSPRSGPRPRQRRRGGHRLCSPADAPSRRCRGPRICESRRAGHAAAPGGAGLRALVRREAQVTPICGPYPLADIEGH